MLPRTKRSFSSTLLPTFVLTYIIIFVNFGKESKNDMDKLYVKKPTNGYVGKRKEQDYEQYIIAGR